jgi:hypothetical protein
MLMKKLQKIKAIATASEPSASTIMEIFILKNWGEKLGLNIKDNVKIILTHPGQKLSEGKAILRVGIDGDHIQKEATEKNKNVAYLAACKAHVVDEPALVVLLGDLMHKRKNDPKSIEALIATLKKDHSQKMVKVIIETLGDLEDRYQLLNIMNDQYDKSARIRKVDGGSLKVVSIITPKAEKFTAQRQADCMTGIAFLTKQTDVLIHRTTPWGNFITTSEELKEHRGVILKKLISAEKKRSSNGTIDLATIWKEEHGIIQTKLGYSSRMKFDEISEIVTGCFSHQEAPSHSWVHSSQQEAAVA